MIISVNSNADKSSFEGLLSCSLFTLQQRAKKYPKMYMSLLGTKLEREIVGVLNENAVNTPFENSIELVSGQKFPDIVAKKYYGVEVKTTQKNHWCTTGSSVAEGTRVSDVERIFMLFGKMTNPVEFRCRPYEECLSDVVVTHSPRYLIDMNLKQGETFFDKLKIPYNDLRKQNNPIQTVVKFYKKQLKSGERLWWMGEDEEEQTTSSLIIRLWNNLSKQEQHYYVCFGFCLFPELLGNSMDKFNRFALWLSTQKAVVCPNVRDLFSAGGRVDIVLENGKTVNVSQILFRLYNNLEMIFDILKTTPTAELSEYWGCNVTESNKVKVWKSMVKQCCKETALNEIFG